MIQISFRYGGEIVAVIIRGNELLFHNTSSLMTTPIDGLKLNKSGVIKEFPELKDDEEWKKKSIKKFKDHIKSLDGEINKMNYIKEDLKKYGYVPLYFQRAGHRPKKFKD